MNKKRRLLSLAVFALVVAASFWKLFYTDKRSASGPVEVPLAWLSEEQLLSFEQGHLFLREQGGTRSEIFALAPPANMFSTADACIADDRRWLTTAQKTVSGSGISSSLIGPISLEIEHGSGRSISVLEVIQQERLANPVPTSCKRDHESDAATAFLRSNEQYQADRRITVDRKTYFLRHLNAVYEERLSYGSLSSAPNGGHLYLNDQPRGLMSLKGKRVEVHPFSDEYIDSFGTSLVSSWGYALWDRSLEQVLFVQSACEPDESGLPCTRKAQWLTADLEPLHIVELPGETLVKIKAGYSCFSCGCGCYSHQELYVEGGNIFAHVWGYPVVNGIRGIYRLKQSSSGPYWEKIISGRPRPPLAFSPSGAKVAYFELSRWGDRFVVADVPDDT
jgi:hypothetical protein